MNKLNNLMNELSDTMDDIKEFKIKLKEGNDSAFTSIVVFIVIFLVIIATACLLEYKLWGLVPVVFIAMAGCVITRKVLDYKKEVQFRKTELDVHANEQRLRAEEQRLRELKDSAQDSLETFSRYLTPCLIIDSNIWMNEFYDSFFELLADACRFHRYKLSFFGPQLNEISNIKIKTQYGEEKNKRARLAINRIEEFQKKDLLNIEAITIAESYADPLILNVLATRAREGNKCTFISNDKELRIRARQYLKDNAREWGAGVVEIESILHECDTFSEAKAKKLIA